MSRNIIFLHHLKMSKIILSPKATQKVDHGLCSSLSTSVVEGPTFWMCPIVCLGVHSFLADYYKGMVGISCWSTAKDL